MIIRLLKGKDGPQILKQRAFKGTGLWPTIHSIFSQTSRDKALKMLEQINNAISIEPTRKIGIDNLKFGR